MKCLLGFSAFVTSLAMLISSGAYAQKVESGGTAGPAGTIYGRQNVPGTPSYNRNANHYDDDFYEDDDDDRSSQSRSRSSNDDGDRQYEQRRATRSSGSSSTSSNSPSRNTFNRNDEDNNDRRSSNYADDDEYNSPRPSTQNRGLDRARSRSSQNSTRRTVDSDSSSRRDGGEGYTRDGRRTWNDDSNAYSRQGTRRNSYGSDLRDDDRDRSGDREGRRNENVRWDDNDRRSERSYARDRSGDRWEEDRRVDNRRAQLGITLDQEYQDRLVIRSVTRDSAARRAGLRAGDTLLALDGQRVRSLSDLRNTLADYEPGDSVEVRYMRDGERDTVDVRLEAYRVGRMERDDRQFDDRSRLGSRESEPYSAGYRGLDSDSSHDGIRSTRTNEPVENRARSSNRSTFDNNSEKNDDSSDQDNNEKHSEEQDDNS